jgi:cytochrome c556
MRRSVRLTVAATLAAMGSVVFLSTALAQNAPPTPEEQAKQAVLVRKSVFEVMSWNFSPLAAMLRKRIPFDAEVAQKAAIRVEQMAPMIIDAFQQDTRKFQVETRAREAVWSNKADFDAKANDLVKAAAALTAAAKTGDQAQTLKAAAQVGKVCGACHDSFRTD